MGMFSAVMGGVIRDVLTNEIPIIFKKEIYATACLAGATLYLLLNYIGCERNANVLISALLVIRALIRYVSSHDFTAFAWYRIAFGIVILATAWSGLVSWAG